MSRTCEYNNGECTREGCTKFDECQAMQCMEDANRWTTFTEEFAEQDDGVWVFRGGLIRDGDLNQSIDRVFGINGETARL